MKNKDPIVKILENVVIIIICIKIVFAFSLVGNVFFTHFKKTSTKSEKYHTLFVHLKEVTEFIFIICMSLLLIFIFNPWYKHQIYISREIALLFYLFGFILLITANWNIVTKESYFFKKIQASLK